ncbi:hypothetical protein GCM10009678_54970 [Actinomadura kijaniata]|uniref:Uncharacterized protein n=1 Tax=Actinomadura namibiensis TaxID=182080 RepID=A0A7W3QMU6_ACTNM|nr:hypothetical protein [Actinomadura namibiensis]MBA8952871.1 hypothetical protein [Actinomadura namibiensis]
MRLPACGLLSRDQVAAAVPVRGVLNGRRAPRPTACGFTLRDGTPVLVTVEWVARDSEEAERVYLGEVDSLYKEGATPRPVSPTLRIVRGLHLEDVFDTALIRSGRVIVRVTAQHSPGAIRRIALLVERRL